MLGFFKLVQAKVCQAIQHEQLRAVADKVDRHRVDQVRHFLQRGLRFFGLAIALGEQRLQVGGAWFTGGNTAQLGQVGRCIGSTVQVQQQACARHPRFHMLRLRLDGPCVGSQGGLQVTRNVGNRTLLVPDLGRLWGQAQSAVDCHSGLFELPRPDANGHLGQPDAGFAAVNGAGFFDRLHGVAHVAQVGAGRGAQ